MCAAVHILLLHKHHCTCKATQLIVQHPCICTYYCYRNISILAGPYNWLHHWWCI